MYGEIVNIFQCEQKQGQNTECNEIYQPTRSFKSVNEFNDLSAKTV